MVWQAIHRPYSTIIIIPQGFEIVNSFLKNSFRKSGKNFGDLRVLGGRKAKTRPAFSAKRGFLRFVLYFYAEKFGFRFDAVKKQAVEKRAAFFLGRLFEKMLPKKGVALRFVERF